MFDFLLFIHTRNDWFFTKFPLFSVIWNRSPLALGLEPNIWTCQIPMKFAPLHACIEHGIMKTDANSKTWQIKYLSSWKFLVFFMPISPTFVSIQIAVNDSVMCVNILCSQNKESITLYFVDLQLSPKLPLPLIGSKKKKRVWLSELMKVYNNKPEIQPIKTH